MSEEPATQLSDGNPVPEDRSHTKLKSNGQQEGYVVLSPEERAKGFVRPVRRAYQHVGPPGGGACNSVTTMSRDIAETYARTPNFYSGTFCVACRTHRPVGADGEFVWVDDPDQRVGT